MSGYWSETQRRKAAKPVCRWVHPAPVHPDPVVRQFLADARALSERLAYARLTSR